MRVGRSSAGRAPNTSARTACEPRTGNPQATPHLCPPELGLALGGPIQAGFALPTEASSSVHANKTERRRIAEIRCSGAGTGARLARRMRQRKHHRRRFSSKQGRSRSIREGGAHPCPGSCAQTICAHRSRKHENAQRLSDRNQRVQRRRTCSRAERRATTPLRGVNRTSRARLRSGRPDRTRSACHLGAYRLDASRRRGQGCGWQGSFRDGGR